MLDGSRVLHLQKALGIGGSERHIIDLCAGLRRFGARSEVLWLVDPHHPIDPLLALAAAAQVPCAVLPIRADLDPGLCARLCDFLRARPPDLLHAHLIHATLYGACAARRVGVPAMIATRHRDEGYQRLPWFRWAIRYADRTCARVIAPSQWVASYTRRWDGTPVEKIRVIRHGIDLARFELAPERRRALREAERTRLGIQDGEPVIGCVARLHPSKDHETLLRAFAQLLDQHPSAHLLLLGRGPLETRLRARAAELLGRTRAGRVVFLGERADVEAVLAACDIAALATHREGFCLAALEAMACGLAIVATRVGPLPELIEHERVGLLVAPGAPAAMASALAQLCTDTARRQAFGCAAQVAAGSYSLAQMVDATAALYAEALGRHRGSPARDPVGSD